MVRMKTSETRGYLHILPGAWVGVWWGVYSKYLACKCEGYTTSTASRQTSSTYRAQNNTQVDNDIQPWLWCVWRGPLWPLAVPGI